MQWKTQLTWLSSGGVSTCERLPDWLLHCGSPKIVTAAWVLNSPDVTTLLQVPFPVHSSVVNPQGEPNLPSMQRAIPVPVSSALVQEELLCLLIASPAPRSAPAYTTCHLCLVQACPQAVGWHCFGLSSAGVSVPPAEGNLVHRAHAYS
jgi:hypothetical protein